MSREEEPSNVRFGVVSCMPEWVEKSALSGDVALLRKHGWFVVLEEDGKVLVRFDLRSADALAGKPEHVIAAVEKVYKTERGLDLAELVAAVEASEL